MSFKIDMTSTDVDRQIELLKFYPEVMEKHFRDALKRSVKLVEEEIRPNIPTMTSRARNKFKSRVTGTGINLQGQVGWWGKNMPWYINVVEHGSRRHPINAGTSSRSRGARDRFETGDIQFGNLPGADRGGTHIYVRGRWVTKTVVNGMSARGFMAAGFSATQPLVNTEMAIASEAVVKEMAVP